MLREARNNRAVIRLTPAVPNTTYIISRNLIPMTTTDNISSTELMCSTGRARRRSRNSRDVPRSIYVAIQSIVILFSGYSVATNSLATQS